MPTIVVQGRDARQCVDDEVIWHCGMGPSPRVQAPSPSDETSLALGVMLMAGQQNAGPRASTANLAEDFITHIVATRIAGNRRAGGRGVTQPNFFRAGGR